MFAPETEDMLPRAAPKPSASVPIGHTEEIVKPTVPEVSILFGQIPPASQQQPEQVQTQRQERIAPTFASWKKQMLPRVTFPSELTTELGPSTVSSVSSSSNGSEYSTTNHPRARNYATNTQTQVQPLLSNPIVNYAEPLGHYQREMYSGLPQRRSLDETTIMPRMVVPVPMGSAQNVLTICAGTQTEAVNISTRSDKLTTTKMDDLGHLASKEDIKEILNLLKFVCQEQQQLRYLCESFSQQTQSKQSTSSRDIGTQYEIASVNINDTPVKRLMTPMRQDNIPEEAELRPSSPVPYNPIRGLAQFNAPRVQPIAQSTAYRANTPQGKHAATPPSNLPMIATVLPKANTDKSLVMNELALKYLPQQHLNDLMHEMHLSPTHKEKGPNIESPKILNMTPLRQIDNLNQSPNDISNASYKYLKKYRLLPEEQMEHQFQSPMNMRKQQRIGSPLTLQSPQQEQQPMIDLENIRNQPKLL